MKLREFDISVPWGHIAVKSWGNESHFPIIAIHGVQDNAGTFDKLVPLLPQTFNYVCIDLPSHGRSSRFTEHIPIHVWNFVLALKVVADQFNWDKFILMGHSLGAQIAIHFALIFPEKLEKLILLDMISFLPIEPDKFVRHLYRYEKFLEIENRQLSNEPVYTFDEALQVLIKQRILFPLKRKVAEIILKRNVVEVSANKYQFRLDPRLTCYIHFLYDKSYFLNVLKANPIKCPTLILLATENAWNWPRPILQAFQNQKNVKVQWISGDHYFHIVDAKSVALVIGNFLGLPKSKM